MTETFSSFKSDKYKSVSGEEATIRSHQIKQKYFAGGKICQVQNYNKLEKK